MKRLFILIALVSALAIAGDTMGAALAAVVVDVAAGVAAVDLAGVAAADAASAAAEARAHALVRRRRKPALDVVSAPFESAFLHSAKPAGYGRIATCESTERQSEQSAKLGCE